MEGGRSWFCAVSLLSQGFSLPSGFRHLTGSANCDAGHFPLKGFTGSAQSTQATYNPVFGKALQVQASRVQPA